MERQFYIDLAASHLRMPIGTDLVLHEQPDPESILLDGRRLGQVTESAAGRYRTPLAVPLMDLRLEKADLLKALGVSEQEVDTYHFSAAPDEAALSTARQAQNSPFSRRNQAHIDSIAYIAGKTDLVPVGMGIGPFSLTTKLMSDPITAIAMAGMGMTAEEDAGVLMVERCLALAEMTVSRWIGAQAAAGARAVIICEPAANRVFLSPKQLEAGSDVFERFVMQPNLRLKQQLSKAGADLIFHNCGDLIPMMVREFAERLDPVILSLGSSRKLWEDAALVPKNVVLYGNLPTKNFYSDSVMPVERVEKLVTELIEKMHAANHPHILGSECDVLHVPEAAASIRHKVDVMLGHNCRG
ncbi:MAG: uroporphyrinogen decarboxylase family protein [Bryobacteraceae bacterium]